jgi:hypothetical protein
LAGWDVTSFFLPPKEGKKKRFGSSYLKFLNLMFTKVFENVQNVDFVFFLVSNKKSALLVL